MSRVYFGKLLLRVEVFFCIPKRNADVNFEIHFLRLGLLGVQTIFETISCSMSELFIAKWRNLCQFHHVVSAAVVLATLSTFQFQILVLPKCRVFQGTMTFLAIFGQMTTNS